MMRMGVPIAIIMVMSVSASSEAYLGGDVEPLVESLVELETGVAELGPRLPGGPGPTTAKTPGANPNVVQGKPNNAPKQMHLKKMKQMPGKPLKAIGYPNKKRLRGNEGKNLLNREPTLDITGHKAEDRIYPGGGKMNAKDAHGIAAETRPMLDIVARAKKMDEDQERKKYAMRQKATDKLIAETKLKMKGQAMLNGKLGHDISVARGNLLNCKSKLAKCKGKKTTTLGESKNSLTPEESGVSDADVKQIKTTAIQDDRKSRGVKDPAAKEKAKPAGERFKRTAQQKYVHKQKKMYMIDNAPGWKFKHDRFPRKELPKVTEKAERLIQRSKKFDKTENDRDFQAIKDADKKADDAIVAIAQARKKRLDADKPESTADVMKGFRKVNSELYQCMKEVQTACKK
jgi:hypothetical protein